MKFLIPKPTSRGIVLILFGMMSLFCAATMAQPQFINGARRGIVKVKFSPSVATAVRNMQVSYTGGRPSIGIASFDKVAVSVKAVSLTRLFPVNARNEAKLRKHGLDLWYIVEIPEGEDPQRIAQQFGNLKEIAVAEVDYQKSLSPYTITELQPMATTSNALPYNDPLLKDQWHYQNTGQVSENKTDVNLFKAWQTTTGSANVIVAVHDEGVDATHEDLRANMWVNNAELNGQPGIDDDNNGFIDDVNGYNFARRTGKIDAGYHGTHVAGTVAAVTNNGKGVAGVAGGNGSGNGARIMSLQIFGGSALIENTYIYAADNGAVISQNSWGYTNPGYFDQSVKEAIDYFIAEAGNYPGSPMKGGIVIFAAGNSSFDADWYPGFYSPILTVASTGPDGVRAPYSNYGAWIEVSAPGGNQDDYGAKGGVLSTVPGNKYGYLQGTSMACPHVSGIAALALANQTTQTTNTALWNKLVTGTTDVYTVNPDFEGKLGTGTIDAWLAIQNNAFKIPATITDVQVTGAAQEFITLSFTTPTDEDDGQPKSFSLYYATQPLTAQNLALAQKVVIPVRTKAGEIVNYELAGLKGQTTYYVAVVSTDRWGNVSAISNVATGTTDKGPKITVDENNQSISLSIDATTGTTANHLLTIRNEDTGILRWSSLTRNKTRQVAFSNAGLRYPVAKQISGSTKVGMRLAQKAASISSTNEFDFEPIEKSLALFATNNIGETDLSISNSAAARFTVTEEVGFNLTDVTLYLNVDPANGPIIVEIYKGASQPNASTRLLAQEYNAPYKFEGNAFVKLDEQLFFEKGENFWVVYHVPANNLFPLGIGYESEPDNSKACLISFTVGNQWQSLEEALGAKDFAYVISARSSNPDMGTFITLDPTSGDVAGQSFAEINIQANAAQLVNGSYESNLIFKSNDPETPELRIPVSLTVSGQQAHLKTVQILDFGAVFRGSKKIVDLTITNEGYGNFSVVSADINNASFSFAEGAPWQFPARSRQVVKVTFAPTATGNINGTITLSNGITSIVIPVVGVGMATAAITVTPTTQTKTNLAIGNIVNAQVQVTNTGAYPLKYFVPGFDTKGIAASWEGTFHEYGYKVRTNAPGEPTPLTYTFQDISTTGVKITQQFKTFDNYVPVEFDFDFPYYNKVMNKIYITSKGFTTFDTEFNPVNVPRLGSDWNPRGYISPLGSFFDYSLDGHDVYYQVFADRLIIQYHTVTDGFSSGTITAQMVLHANGNIRFYYKEIGWPAENHVNLNILIESYDRRDGILINSYEKPATLFNNMVIGFDYPGPDIITSISNGSGIVMPGDSQIIDVELNTATIPEGTTNRYLNIISNDPAKTQSNPLIQLQVTSGGVANPVFSTDTLQFGDVYRGAIKKAQFTVKNTGNANVRIQSVARRYNKFTFTGQTSGNIIPGIASTYTVTVPTTTITPLYDEIIFTYMDNTRDTVVLYANVVAAPNINVNLAAVNQTLTPGQQYQESFVVTNTGANTLRVSTSGTNWLRVESAQAPTGITYAYEKHNTGGVYQWIDLRTQNATQFPFDTNLNDEEGFYKEVNLPFTFTYYGTPYTKMLVGENGVVSFDENPRMTFFSDVIPTQNFEGAAIFPYWTFGGFDTYNYDPSTVGLFYKAYADRIVLQWTKLVNYAGGMGDPISVQMHMYSNGTLRFLYKVEDEGGWDATSRMTNIGLQKNSNEGISISSYYSIDHGKGLVYTLHPVADYEIAPAGIFSGNLILDATHLFGGTYTSALNIYSNVPAKEHLTKPVTLQVAGVANLTAPPTVDFGKEVVVAENWSYKTYVKNIVLRNEGNAPVTITNMQANEPGNGLTLQLFVKGSFFFPDAWLPIEDIYSPWGTPPVYILLPGDELNVRAAFTPTAAGSLVNEIVITTDGEEKRIALSGEGVLPPVLQVDTTPIAVSMITKSETALRSIAFDNLNGASDLLYSLSLQYYRVTQPTATAERMGTSAVFGTLKADPTRVILPAQRTSSTYTRIVSHTDKNTPDTFVGTGGTESFTLATKFNSGNANLNLSHVETWFRSESLVGGNIQVQIRAGAADIANAGIVAQGQITFAGSGADDEGEWHTIALDQPVLFFPGEDFYVVVTYPLGIEFPQGTITDSERVANRYLYSNEGEWYDLQAVPGFTNAGWLMYAAETKTIDETWIGITSEKMGVVEPGNTTNINLSFNGAFAKPGAQNVFVVITSNDPANAEVKIPVQLNLNDAPRILQIPSEIYSTEGTTRKLTLSVRDFDGDTYTVKEKTANPYFSWTFANHTLNLEIAFDYEAEGNHTYTFVLEDEHGAKREQSIFVVAEHANQAPKFLGEEKEFAYHRVGLTKEHTITDLFTDPDGDAYTYSVRNLDEEVVTIFAAPDKFLVQTESLGEAKVVFTVTDEWGASYIDTLTFKVDAIAGVETKDSTLKVSVYPNPTSEVAYVLLGESQDEIEKIQLTDAKGFEIVIPIEKINALNWRVQTKALAPGLYLIHVKTSRQSEVIRLIKK